MELKRKQAEGVELSAAEAAELKKLLAAQGKSDGCCSMQ